MFKEITDRAFTDIGSALFVWNSTLNKYAFLMPVTNMPATGSAPDQQEKTVTTDRKKTYIAARQDNPQKEFTFYAHRDNFNAVKALGNGQHEFLQLNPDYTGYKFTGSVSMYQDETSVGNNITAKLVITVSYSELDPVTNVYDLIADAVTFTSEIPDTIELATTTGTATVSVKTDPAGATVTANSGAVGTATANISSGTLTITGVAKGSVLVTLTATSSNMSDGKRTILVIVP